MSTRRGFTLIEVMIALLIGSVVTVLAYATFAAGLDTQARVTQAQETDDAATAMRAVLTDALRHAVAGDATDPRGLHTDARGATLQFVTRGIEPPFGGSGPWRVLLTTDSAGLVLTATPLTAGRAPLRLQAPGHATLAMRFLPIASSDWRETWDDPSRLPEAVEVRFLDANGRDATPPVLARTAPVSGT